MSQKCSTRARPAQSGGRLSGKPYQHSQAEYSAQYSKPLVTIKRWWKRRLPLDDPDAMGEYLSPRGRKSAAPAPDPFERPSRIPVRDPDLDDLPSHLFEATEDPLDVPSPVKLDASFFEGTGILAAIERLQKAERERAAAYFEAIFRRCNAQVIQNRFREWTGIVEALRKLSKDEPDIRRANRLTIDRSEAQADVGKVFGALAVAMNSLPGRATNKILGLKTRDEILDVLEHEIAVLRSCLIATAVAAAEEES